MSSLVTCMHLDVRPCSRPPLPNLLSCVPRCPPIGPTASSLPSLYFRPFEGHVFEEMGRPVVVRVLKTRSRIDPDAHRCCPGKGMGFCRDPQSIRQCRDLYRQVLCSFSTSRQAYLCFRDRPEKRVDFGRRRRKGTILHIRRRFAVECCLYQCCERTHTRRQTAPSE